MRPGSFPRWLVCLLLLAFLPASSGACRDAASGESPRSSSETSVRASLPTPVEEPSADVGQPTVTIRGRAFTVEVADTAEEQGRGLSGRDSLPEGAGMLFDFANPGFHTFWMNEMRFAIDIVFIFQGRVVVVVKGAQPPAGSEQGRLPIFRPPRPVDRVLEIQAGLSERYGFQEGDEVTYQGLEERTG